jgi:hypothetical protein
MSMYSDAILVDPNELREAAGSLRRAADESVDVRQRIPAEAWGSPEWQAAALGHELGLLRLELERLSSDLINQANVMQRRADEVEGAERRWWEIANGELRCGCVLPGGAIVAVPTIGTAASSAWGPGVTQTSPPPIVIGTAASSASGGAVVIGGGGLPMPVPTGEAGTPGGVVIGGGGLPMPVRTGEAGTPGGVVIGGGGLPEVVVGAGTSTGPGIATIGGGGGQSLDMSGVNLPGLDREGFTLNMPHGGYYGPAADAARTVAAGSVAIGITHSLGRARSALDAANSPLNLDPDYTTRTRLDGSSEVVYRADYPGL